MSWTIVIKQKIPNDFDGKILGTIKDCLDEQDAITKAFIVYGKRTDVYFETKDENAMVFDHLAVTHCVKCQCEMKQVQMNSEFLSAICQDCSDAIEQNPLISDVEFVETVTKTH
jgi:hypothetical protein